MLVSRLLAGAVLVAAAFALFVCCGDLYRQSMTEPGAPGERPADSAELFSIYQMDVAPGAQTAVLYGCRHQLYCVDLKTGESIEFDGIRRDDIRAVSQSSDGSVIAVGYADGSIAFHSSALFGPATRIERSHSGPVHCLDVSDDGRLALSGGHDGAVLLWRLDADQPVRLADDLQDGVAEFRFSPDGTRVAAGFGNGRVICWRAEDGQVVGNFQANRSRISGLDFSRDGRQLLTTALDGYLRVWDLQTGQVRETFLRKPGEGDYRGPHSVAASPDGRTLAIGGFKRIVILERPSLTTLAELFGHENGVSCLQFSHDGKHLFSASYDGTLRAWDMDQGMNVHCWTPIPPDVLRDGE